MTVRTADRRAEAQANATDAGAVAKDLDRCSDVDRQGVAGEDAVTLGTRLRLLSHMVGLDDTDHRAEAGANTTDSGGIAADVDGRREVDRQRVAGEDAIALGTRRSRLRYVGRTGWRNPCKQDAEACDQAGTRDTEALASQNSLLR